MHWLVSLSNNINSSFLHARFEWNTKPAFIFNVSCLKNDNKVVMFVNSGGNEPSVKCTKAENGTLFIVRW